MAEFPGDTTVFKKVLADQVSNLISVAEKARATGAIHHRFGVWDGFVVIVDGWESLQQFEQFFGQPDIQALVGEMGASGPPDIIISEAITSPDQF